MVAFVISLIIALGCSVMIFQLSAGGRSIATLLGGHLLPSSQANAHERRLRNVVEEMALASGLPMPDIYILAEEPGINAFAAGHSPKDAVIGVTRGTLQTLTRDELQGVIAHEFSHILNGDMRLNMRLTCLCHGILYLSETGRLIIDLAFRHGLRFSNNRSSGVFIFLALAFCGLVLMAIGSIGYFVTRLLRAAISRQREFLADAAAVQFTRNPGGIGSALKKSPASRADPACKPAVEISSVTSSLRMERRIYWEISSRRIPRCWSEFGP
ncbi:MAG: M48 family metalloprotease [Blastochloris sp.]|nr:M48 family metalloprotease [Blastochloris sp.]